MKALSAVANVVCFITTPIWWMALLFVEVMQIFLFDTSEDKLLGPSIYKWLQRNKAHPA